MLDYAGVTPPTRMQGRSLAALTKGNTPADWRKSYYYEHHFVPDPSWNMVLPRNEGIRTARWKYIQYIDSKPLFEELYDLDADPLEINNLAAHRSQSARIKRFRQQLREMRQQISAAPPTN